MSGVDLEDDGLPKKKGPGPVRKILVVAAVLACAGFWIWTRYGVVKQPLGGPCTWAIDCGKEAPRCMRPDVDAPGICSRACVPPDDCAEGIRCVEVELDTRDENGNYVKEGTCVPQTFLDARKAKARGDAGPVVASRDDSWIDVPDGDSAVEGELVVRRAGGEKTFLVKGTLVRTPEEGTTRKVIDTASLRVFSVDDKKHTFTASVLDGASASDEVTVTKTTTKDRVADRECDVWEIAAKGGRQTACVVLGGAFVDPAAGSVTPWMRELATRAAMPLRVVDVDGKGRETSRLEVTRYTPRRLDRALFLVPKSYKNVGR